MELSEYSADLHVHSCLSPCAELEMSPVSLTERASAAGLDLIAVCDHNSAENVEAVIKAATAHGMAVIPGMEVTSSEEVHILGLFPTLADAVGAQAEVYEHLFGENDEKAFGLQVVADEDDNVVGFNSKLLIGATELDVSQVISLIHQNNGLAIASHVDREGFSITGQLGFIPEGLPLDAIELTRNAAQGAELQIPGNGKRFPVIRSSDAHRLEEIGSVRTRFLFAEATFSEIEMAFRGEKGRRVLDEE